MLDTDIGDIHAEIVDMEIEISQQLQGEVQGKLEFCKDLSKIIGEVDWLQLC